MYLSLVNEENYQISLGRVFFLLNQIVGLAFLFIYLFIIITIIKEWLGGGDQCSFSTWL